MLHSNNALSKMLLALGCAACLALPACVEPDPGDEGPTAELDADDLGDDEDEGADLDADAPEASPQSEEPPTDVQCTTPECRELGGS
ncbi:MAG: hypothetical protein R3F14_07660 [Polyangiaceae bacterium]